MLGKKKKEENSKDPEGFYKGYDIKWLKSVKNEHPDGHLVDEYEKKNGEVK